jgi:formate dehydrogenase subunit gamma
LISGSRPRLGGELERFDGAERILHWANAVLVGVLLATGLVLYLGELSSLVGRRNLVRDIHVAAGLALPIPLLLSLPGRRGRGLRRDLSVLNRFSPDDWRWLRSRGRAAGVRLGKFNPGQKLNAAFVAGAGVVLLASGCVMRFFHPFPLEWRTGATFVHDWTALGLGLAVVGHVGLAMADPESLNSMLTGRVPRWWALHQRPLWYEEQTGEPAESDAAPTEAAEGTRAPGP